MTMTHSSLWVRGGRTVDLSGGFAQSFPHHISLWNISTSSHSNNTFVNLSPNCQIKFAFSLFCPDQRTVQWVTSDGFYYRLPCAITLHWLIFVGGISHFCVLTIGLQHFFELGTFPFWDTQATCIYSERISRLNPFSQLSRSRATLSLQPWT